MSRKLTIHRNRGRVRFLLLAGGILATAPSAPCQDLVDQVLISFPAETQRVEYARPAELRKLPGYAQMREQFLGVRLSAMDTALSVLGIVEGDIDEAMLAWTPRQPHRPAAEVQDRAQTDGSGDEDGKFKELPTELAGLLAGRFDRIRVAGFAAAQGLVSIRIHGEDAYCPGQKAAGACLAVLSESMAAFGEPAALNRLLMTRLGLHSSLSADRQFTRLINEVNRYAPIWGIATESTVSEWFRGWVPAGGQAPVDWRQAFDAVEAFTYSIEVGEKLKLSASLQAASSEAAERLHQFFSGLRILLTLFWQAQAPSEPNPLAGLQVTTQGRVCRFTLSSTLREITAYQNSPLRPFAPLPDASSSKKGESGRPR